jgi:hypothetical protein
LLWGMPRISTGGWTDKTVVLPELEPMALGTIPASLVKTERLGRIHRPPANFFTEGCRLARTYRGRCRHRVDRVLLQKRDQPFPGPRFPRPTHTARAGSADVRRLKPRAKGPSPLKATKTAPCAQKGFFNKIVVGVMQRAYHAETMQS